MIDKLHLRPVINQNLHSLLPLLGGYISRIIEEVILLIDCKVIILHELKSRYVFDSRPNCELNFDIITCVIFEVSKCCLVLQIDLELANIKSIDNIADLLGRV